MQHDLKFYRNVQSEVCEMLYSNALYRGKLKSENCDHKKGDWVHGYFVVIKDGKRHIPCIYGYGEVDNHTVCRFTGFYDKDDNRIYEGDILESRYDEDNPNDFCRELVLWKDYGWHIKQLPDSREEPMDYFKEICSRCCKVVGNIYDNPELLEVSE